MQPDPDTSPFETPRFEYVEKGFDFIDRWFERGLRKAARRKEPPQWRLQVCRNVPEERWFRRVILRRKVRVEIAFTGPMPDGSELAVNFHSPNTLVLPNGFECKDMLSALLDVPAPSA